MQSGNSNKEINSLATELLKYTARHVASDSILVVKLMALMAKLGKPMTRYCSIGCNDAMNFLSQTLNIKREHGKEI